MSPITQIQDNSHILGIYSSPQRKIEDGLEYLRIGFEEKNEAILMITDELTKDEIRNEIIKKWNISSTDELADLEKNFIINLKSSTEVYSLTDIIDHNNFFSQSSNLMMEAIDNGKRGIRLFADMKTIFERGYEKQVIEYEKSFPPFFDFPMTSICAYNLDDFEKLARQSRKILFDHHNLHLIDNLFRNIFDDSSIIGKIEHICMYHDNKESESISLDIISNTNNNNNNNNGFLRYLGEGLLQNQLCVYFSIYNMKKDHQKTIMSQMSHLNVSSPIENNLMIILNTDSYYINATCDNLTPFEDLKKLLFEKALLGNKTEIRIVCDIPYFLFKNKHFDQCIALEEWWDETIEDLNKRHSLNVSLLCLYNNDNFQKTPFKYHRHRINDNHSIVCDSEGRIHSKFDSHLEGGNRKSEKITKGGSK